MIHKMQKNEEKYKMQIKREKEINLELINENAKLKEKYQEARSFMAQNIQKIEKMMIENETQQNHTSDTSSSFHQQPQFHAFQKYYAETQPTLL